MDVTTILSGAGTDDFVECAARPGVQPSGRVFKKQILKWGSFVHPKNKDVRIKVDRAFADKLITNFSNKACDIVQVPIVDDQNRHSEDPTRNLGEVIDIDCDAKGVNVYIDARKHADDLGRTLLGASAMMHLNYEDTTTGAKVGPTLLHVAATNRPYITKLDPFNEVVAASADTPDEVVLMTAEEPEPDVEETEQHNGEQPEEQPEIPESEPASQPEQDEAPEPAPGGETMTKDELIAALRDQHGIDVAALEEAAAGAEEVAQLSATLGNDELSLRDVAEAVLELSQRNEEQSDLIATLSARNDEMEQRAAEQMVDGLISAGKVLPRQREVMITLSRTQPDVFEQLIPDEAIVSLSEEGVTTHEKSNADEVNTEIDRITSAFKEYLGN